MFRSLFHYRHLNIAVFLGVAVAGSVLTGALMVGDSVRGSLRALTLERLGRIEFVVMTEYLVDRELSDRISKNTQIAENGGVVAPVLMVNGGATAEGRRASGIQITGIENGFVSLFESGPAAKIVEDALQRDSGQVFPSVVINEILARELGVGVGDEMVLTFESASDINRDSLYGRKNRNDIIKRLRLVVKHILPEEGMGRFGLRSGSSLPLNAFVPLRNLQRAMDTGKGVNGQFIAFAEPGSIPIQTVEDAIRDNVTLDDLNLEIRVDQSYAALETPSFFLKPEIAGTAIALAREMALPVLPVSAYLVNRLEKDKNLTPYSLIAATDLTHPLAGTPDAMAGKAPGKDEIWLTQWTAEDLGVSPGDEVQLTAYAVGGDALVEETNTFKVTGVVPMEGIGVDAKLAPEFPGIEDADDMANWDPPFDMDMSLIRARDEDFWDEYRTAPKVLVSLETGKSLWESRFGFYTGIRIGVNGDAGIEETARSYADKLLAALDPLVSGLTLVPVRQQGLQASSGATDFGGLFLAFSFFMIISAALLTGLFFRLSVEQRRSEAGLLLAVGFPLKKVRFRFLREGMFLTAAGASLGALGGFLYADLMMFGLRRWWSLGTSRLYFYFEPVSMIIGFAISVFVALISIYIAVRIVGRTPVTVLVSGGSTAQTRERGRRARWVLTVSLVLAVVMGAAAIVTGAATGLFFGVGSFLLIAGLAGSAILFGDRRVENGLTGMGAMAARNTARQGGRSLVCVSLVACACFVIVSVGLYRGTGAVDPDDRASGAGGFFLEAETDIPLYHGLDSQKSVVDYGFDPGLAEMMDKAEIVSMRLRGGDDASCLNLFAPGKPRVLGLSDPESLHGRFSFQGHLGEDGQDPWTLLRTTYEDGAIPVIGDVNSVMWILHSGLGKDYVIQDGAGRDVTLRFVALVQKSIFQSELIVSEDVFHRLFPEEGGFRYFLFDFKGPNRELLATGLEEVLEGFGFDAGSTSDKIVRFHEIENTYISIFQMLGGLGLLLGTLGLGAILFRNAMERKGEFAAMRAFGYRKKRIARLLLAENAVLIAQGIVIGALSAVVALAPHLIASHTKPSVIVLVLTLAGVFVFGMTSSAFAIARTNRIPLLPALRGK